MKAVSACTYCKALSLAPPGSLCVPCLREYPVPRKLAPAGVLLEGLDVAGIVAEEGDRILEECARALDLLEAAQASGPEDREPIQEGDYP